MLFRSRLRPLCGVVSTSERRVRIWWSWGESNPRPSGIARPRYDHSRFGADATPPAGRLLSCLSRVPSFRHGIGLSRRQLSFPLSSSASVAGLRRTGPVRHCWSRCLSTGIRPRERTAGWQFLLLPRFESLSNSGRTYEQRNWCRNLSAP